MNVNAWICGVAVLFGTTVGCSSGPTSNVATASGAINASAGWNGCSGSFDTHESPTGAYFVTDFGCSSAPAFTDSSDNCCPSGVVVAASDGLCKAGTTTAGCTDNVGTSASIACERAVNWFSTGGSTYGLGTRLELTRPDTGTSVVVFVLDNGPACYREQQFGGFALDISYPAILALYGEEEGVSDRATVTVKVVPASTPLGVVGAGSTAPDAGIATGDAASVIGGGHDAGSSNPDAGHDANHETGHPADAVTLGHDGGSDSGHDGGHDSGPGDASDDDAPAADAGGDDSGTGTPCTTDGECNPGSDGSGQYCSGGFCIAGCDADWECPGSTTCVGMTCQ
jgi:hypothetical protein